MAATFEREAGSHRFSVPQEMAAKLYSQAILIVLEWKYLDKRACSKAQAKAYVEQMVRGIGPQ